MRFFGDRRRNYSGMWGAEPENGESSSLALQSPPAAQAPKASLRFLLEGARFCLFYRSEAYYDGIEDEFLPKLTYVRLGRREWRWGRASRFDRQLGLQATAPWAARCVVELACLSLSLSTGGFLAFRCHGRPIAAIRIGHYVWSWFRGIERIQPRFT